MSFRDKSEELKKLFLHTASWYRMGSRQSSIMGSSSQIMRDGSISVVLTGQDPEDSLVGLSRSRVSEVRRKIEVRRRGFEESEGRERDRRLLHVAAVDSASVSSRRSEFALLAGLSLLRENRGGGDEREA